jgi:hypothetical protein
MAQSVTSGSEVITAGITPADSTASMVLSANAAASWTRWPSESTLARRPFPEANERIGIKAVTGTIKG